MEHKQKRTPSKMAVSIAALQKEGFKIDAENYNRAYLTKKGRISNQRAQVDSDGSVNGQTLEDYLSAV